MYHSFGADSFALTRVIIAFILCSTSILAENRQTSIRGRIIDPDGAAIPGARITAQTDQQRAFTTISDRNGEFFLSLETGEYTLMISAAGFAETRLQVTLKVTAPGSLEIALQLAPSSAFVTVTDGGGYLTQTTSATKTLSSLRDVPQSITVISREQIRDQSLQSIADVANYVPGIVAHQGENNRDQLVIRGNSTSADFFLNGARDDVQYYRDLYNVDSVEAIKGPNAMIFGRGGGGGVINRVTKEAVFLRVGEMTLQAGSFQNRRITGDLNQRLSGTIAFRINGLYENSGSFRDSVSLQRYGVNPTITIAPDSLTKITVGYEHFHDGRTADRGIPSFRGRPADTSISTFFGNPDDSRVRANVNLLSGLIDRQFGRFNFRNRTMFGDYDRFYQNYVPGAVTADKSQVAISAYNNATRRRNIFNQSDLIFTVSTGNIRHTLLVGVELGRQLTNNFRNTGFFNNATTSVLVSYDDPTVNIPVTFRQSAADANNHLRTNLVAGYVQDQVELSKYIQIVAGLRFDYFDLHFQNNRTSDDLRRIDRLLSPRLGVVIKPAEPFSLYANYGVAYLPSAGDQFSSLTTITQQLKPEKFDNYEIGFKWDVGQSLALTAAAYRQNRLNTRATDPADPTRILQTGSSRTDGFELGMNGNVTRSWRIAGGYAYLNAFITSSTTAAVAGKQVAQVPRHTFSIWNNYQLIPKLSVGVGLILRSNSFAAADNAVVLPGFTRADFAIYYSISEKWRLQGNLENAFDTRYYINADGNNNISPGRPRGFRVGLASRF